MSVDDDLDRLYGVPPEEFTALRKELAASAKKRGDADDAKAIAAARRPTTAAWVVNALVRADPTAVPRLTDMSASLRAAHAEMDGSRIRKLTAAQRALVHELVRTAFDAADVGGPSAALRDDVTNTVQAAIADPDVAARLGRLEKAEQFSGFGDFGASSAVTSPRAKKGAGPKSAAPQRSSRPAKRPSAAPTRPAGPSATEVRAARKRRDTAVKAAETAAAAKSDADETVEDQRAALTSARRRYEKLLEQLSAAEHDVNTAEADLEAAQQDAEAAAERARAADAERAEAESALTALEG